MKKFLPLFTVFLVFVFGLAMAFAATTGITHDQNTAITGNTVATQADHGDATLKNTTVEVNNMANDAANPYKSTIGSMITVTTRAPSVWDSAAGMIYLEKSVDETTGELTGQWTTAADIGTQTNLKTSVYTNPATTAITITGDLAYATEIVYGLETGKAAYLAYGRNNHSATFGIA